LKIRHSDNNQVAWKQNDQQYPGDYLAEGEAYQACTKMAVPD